jgi:hypothetical protein
MSTTKHHVTSDVDSSELIDELNFDAYDIDDDDDNDAITYRLTEFPGHQLIPLETAVEECDVWYVRQEEREQEQEQERTSRY